MSLTPTELALVTTGIIYIAGLAMFGAACVADLKFNMRLANKLGWAALLTWLVALGSGLTSLVVVVA